MMFSDHIFVFLMQILSVILAKMANMNLLRGFFFLAPNDASVCCLCRDPATEFWLLYGKSLKAPA